GGGGPGRRRGRERRRRAGGGRRRAHARGLAHRARHRRRDRRNAGQRRRVGGRRVRHLAVALDGLLELVDLRLHLGAVGLRAVDAQEVLVQRERPFLVARQAVGLGRVVEQRRVGLELEGLLEVLGGLGVTAEREHGRGLVDHLARLGVAGVGGGARGG